MRASAESPGQDRERAVLPLVAIIGRPNVGKSTVFNRLVGRRRSIVSDEPGVTRDRIYASVEWSGRDFEVVDTGGIVPGEESEIPRKIFEQARLAIKAASLLLMVVDGRAGRSGADEELASMLRLTGREVFLLVNKVDSAAQEADVADFLSFGFEKVFPLSAEHGRGFTDLLDEIVRTLPQTPEFESGREIRVSIVGRPNAGKSTLLNALVGEDRSMVSSTAGTTRDAVDSLVEHQGRHFRFVDTAGIRHRSRSQEKAERLSVMMARRHLEQTDVAILLIDASQSLAAIDATIGGYVHESGRSLIIAVNKWDLVDKGPSITAEFEKRIRFRLKFADYAPCVFISAKTGQRVHRLFEIAESLYQQRQRRIATGELNAFLREVRLERGGLPAHVRVQYIAQVRVAPPTFVVFASAAGKFHFSFERFLINRLRERFSFEGTPIIIKQRVRKRGGRRGSENP
jgi:GTP-binding protein